MASSPIQPFAGPLSALALALGVTAVSAPTIDGSRAEPAPASLATASASPSRDEPTAGASYYIHFGPTGLCALGNKLDWSEVPAGGAVLFESSRVLAVKGSFDAETLIEVEPESNGTATPYDDEVRVRVTTYGDGPDGETVLLAPMWDTPGGGSLDSMATANTPRHLYLERIDVLASSTGDPTAVVNDTRIPMWASGWFAAIDAGPNGFYGGDGPDCIAGSLLDDVIRGGGGDDFVRAKDGADSVSGGGGNDTIEGGAGEDVLRGQGGVDHLEGGTGEDCHSGGLDGLRDLLDDVGSAGADTYVAEPGVVDGEDVPTIEHVVEEGGWLTEDCL